MRAPRSLRARVTLVALAAVALAGVLAGALLVRAVDRDGREAVDRELRERAERVMRRGGGPGRFLWGGPSRLAEEGSTAAGGGGSQSGAGSGSPGAAQRGPGSPGGRGPDPPPPRGLRPPGADALLLSGSGTFTQVAVRGTLVERRGDVPANPPGVPKANGLATLQIDGRPWRSITVPTTPSGEVRVQILASLAPVEARVDRIRGQVLVLGLAALALTALAAWAFTTLTLRPLARLRAGAAQVSDTQDLATPLPDDEGPEEVRSLAHTLNEMLARLRASTEALERALQATRRFAADAGHELRTPLTSLRADLDALERNPDLPPDQRAALVEEMQAEQVRILHLLEGLQALARGEAAESLPREEVELGDLVDAALFAARRRHPGTRYELDETVGEAAVRGWPGGLRLVLENLLDNAALHGRPDGLVRVHLHPEGDVLALAVEDDGPGVPPAERDRLLEPFTRRAGAGVPGTGLGLAIVAQQVGLHGGEIRLEDGADLGGLRVEVRLPRVPPGAGARSEDGGAERAPSVAPSEVAGRGTRSAP